MRVALVRSRRVSEQGRSGEDGPPDEVGEVGSGQSFSHAVGRVGPRDDRRKGVGGSSPLTLVGCVARAFRRSALATTPDR